MSYGVGSTWQPCLSSIIQWAIIDLAKIRLAEVPCTPCIMPLNRVDHSPVIGFHQKSSPQPAFPLLSKAEAPPNGWGLHQISRQGLGEVLEVTFHALQQQLPPKQQDVNPGAGHRLSILLPDKHESKEAPNQTENVQTRLESSSSSTTSYLEQTASPWFVTPSFCGRLLFSIFSTSSQTRRKPRTFSNSPASANSSKTDLEPGHCWLYGFEMLDYLEHLPSIPFTQQAGSRMQHAEGLAREAGAKEAHLRNYRVTTHFPRPSLQPRGLDREDVP